MSRSALPRVVQDAPPQSEELPLFRLIFLVDALLFRDDTPFPSSQEFRLLGQKLAKYKWSRCNDTMTRRFRSSFGIAPTLCVVVWNRLINNGATAGFKQAPKPVHLLWALLFLKVYNSVTLNATLCGVDEKTFRKWSWFYADAMADLDSQLIRFGRRFINHKGDTCAIVVDGTDFQCHEINRLSKAERQMWYSHKFNRAGLKYEVATCIATGDIVHYNGPFRGAVHDLTIFRLSLKRCLRRGKRVVADRGYRGDRKVVTPNDYDCHSQQHRRAMGALRARHEVVNGKVKDFACMSNMWRHALSKHLCAFRACLVLTQLNHKYGTPLFEVVGYEHPVDNDYRSLASYGS